MRLLPSRVRRLAVLLLAVVCFGASRAGAVELTLWEHEYEDGQKGLDEVLRGFEHANPGIKIKRSHYKTEDLRTQFQTAAMAGGGADVVLAPNDFAGPFAIMRVIQPVTAWVRPGRFSPTVVQAVSDAQGQIWGVPVSRGNHLMLFVNRRLVGKAPETVEELVAVAKQHSNPGKDQYGFAYNLNEPFWFATFLGAYGESPLVKAEPRLNGKGMVEALTLVHDLKFKDRIVPPDCDYSCAETLFVDGKVAMTINGDWDIQKYRLALGQDLIIAPLPKVAATGLFMSPMVSGKYLFLNAKLKGEALAAARSLADYLTTKDVQIQLVHATQRLPALQELDHNAVITGNPDLKASDAATAHGQPMPMDVEMRVVWDAMRPQLQAVMAGRTEPRTAAAVMQQDAQSKIKEMR